jgi:hypothetical protein
MIGSIIGGLVGQGGANAAAGAVGSATKESIAAAQHQQAVNRSDASPWTAAGTSALSEIGKLLGWGELYNPGTDGSVYNYQGDPTGEKKKAAFNAFETSPGYQFRRQEGINALDRSAAARGSLRSGAQMRAVQGFGDGLASEEWGNYQNQLMSLAGMGGQAQQGVMGANTGLTNSIGNWNMAGAQSRGSSYMQGANALASGIGQGINNVMAGAYLGKKAGFF